MPKLSRSNIHYSQGKQCQEKNNKKKMQLFSEAGLLLKPPWLVTL